MNLRHSLFLILATLGGCATYPAPAPESSSGYPVGRASGPVGAGIEDDDYQRAIRYCFDQGKQLVRLPPDADAADPSLPRFGDLRFRCAGPGEPGWKEPVG